MATQQLRQFTRAILLPAAGILLFIAVWWAGTVLLAPPESFLRRFAPQATAGALAGLLASGEIWPHVAASLWRVVVGLLISTAIGFPLGVAVGSLRLVARLTGPIFQFIRMVSPLSWTPLAIILLGVGDAAVFFLIAIGGMWPIVLNTSAAVASLDPRWMTLGRSLGGNRWEIARTIVWPAIRPQVLTGIRLSVGLAWIILVPAEMLGVDSGLGYFILDTRDRLAYPELMAAIIVIGGCGFIIDSAARWLLQPRRAGWGRSLPQRSRTSQPSSHAAAPAGSGVALNAGRGE